MKTSLSTLGRLLFIPALTLSLATFARADVSAGDKMFVQKAAVGGMFEVESGQLAQDKGQSDDVKKFGAHMVKDHSKANDELKSIAGSKGIDVPTALDAKHQKMLDSLQGMSGADFDKAYLADMTKGHEATDALMMKEATSGDDTDLKAFAAKTDKVVKHHIAMLDSIKSNMK
jgi:putative membrane protein